MRSRRGGGRLVKAGGLGRNDEAPLAGEQALVDPAAGTLPIANFAPVLVLGDDLENAFSCEELRVPWLRPHSPLRDREGARRRLCIAIEDQPQSRRTPIPGVSQ